MPDFVPEPPRMLLQAEEEPPPPWVEPAAKAPEPPAADLISSTLAELYFNQGFTDKAIEVYRQVLAREPANERARTRLGELQQLETHPRAEEASVPPGAAWSSTDAGAARRQAIERVISRLEGLRSSLTRR
jgi:tetratricopeptide (TPR) repeat protein